MRPLDSAWTVAAIVIVGIAAMVGIALGTGLEAILVFFLGGVGAVLLAIYPLSDIHETAPAAMHSDENTADTTAAVLEALTDPVLLVRDGRVARRQWRRDRAAGQAYRRRGRPHRDPPSGRRRASRAQLSRQLRGAASNWSGSARSTSAGKCASPSRRRPPARPSGRPQPATMPPSGCASISSPMPATSCARRSPRSSAIIETLGDEKAGGDEAIRERASWSVMFDEARRMQRLVEDLISLSRIEAEKYRAARRARSTSRTLIGEVRASCSMAARRRRTAI